MAVFFMTCQLFCVTSTHKFAAAVACYHYA